MAFLENKLFYKTSRQCVMLKLLARHIIIHTYIRCFNGIKILGDCFSIIIIFIIIITYIKFNIKSLITNKKQLLCILNNTFKLYIIYYYILLYILIILLFTTKIQKYL